MIATNKEAEWLKGRRNRLNTKFERQMRHIKNKYVPLLHLRRKNMNMWHKPIGLDVEKEQIIKTEIINDRYE
jgi:hypothetical protein